MDKSLQIAGASIVSAALGLVVGYKIADKRQAAIYTDRLQAEEESMRVFYTQSKPEKQKYETPEQAVAALIVPEVVQEDPRVKAQKVQYNKIVKEEYVPETDEEAEGAAAAAERQHEENVEALVERNLFESQPDPNKPYVIDQEAFMQNDGDFIQDTLTYYEKGGILADARDNVIDEIEKTVGLGFQRQFGYGSSDDNIVHIRNEKLQLDFEIVKSENSYEEDVLGEIAGTESPRERLRREG